MTKPAPTEQLRAKLARPNRLLLGAVVGTGVAARSLEIGGADFVMATSAARLRIMGQHPIASVLPLRSSNQLVWSYARQEVIMAVEIPVIFGASVFDPALSIPDFVKEIREAGFAGVVNSPSAIHLTGNLRRAVEQLGIGFDRELELLSEARRQALLTIAFARTRHEAEALEEQGVDVICLTFGSTAGGMLAGRDLQASHEIVDSIKKVIRTEGGQRNKPHYIIDAGPISSPDEMIRICRDSGAMGYLGRSSSAGKTLEMTMTDFMATHRRLARPAINSARRDDDELAMFGRQVGLLGHSPKIHEILRVIRKVGASDLAVLIRGENGTGKELVAQAIHISSRRAARPMVTVNCAALPRELLESELFGYEAGAFTGAKNARVGRFEEANGSTLFLDEIGDLEPALQAKLLRVLEGGDFQRLGSNKSRVSDVRIVCATNQDLSALQEEGLFRQDLMYRLNTVEITLPKLSERVEDIPLLAMHFLERAQKFERTIRGFDDTALRKLLTHSWPGNIRELRNAVERAIVMCEGELITARDLPSFTSESNNTAEAIYDNERDWIVAALGRNRYHRGETARYLGMSRKTLYNKMRRYGLVERSAG